MLGLSTAFIFIICTSLLHAETTPPKIQKTSGEQQEWMQQFLEKHLISIVRNGDKIEIESDGLLGILDSNWNWLTKFILVQFDEFIQRPDHHASTKFKLIEIKEGKIIILYESRFDHCSFGSNLITIDIETVEMKYK